MPTEVSLDAELVRELATSDASLCALIEHAQLGMLVHRGGPIAHVNAALLAMLGGRGADELIGRPWSTVMRGDGGAMPASDQPHVTQLASIDTPRWAEVRAIAIDRDGAPATLLVFRDVTAEQTARATLREHVHRIKNNLQVISSLLSLQAQQTSDPATRVAFAQSQARVHAIALVHDQLHPSRPLGAVDLGNYIEQLVHSLLRSRDAAAPQIKVALQLAVVEVTIDSAIPCGLLVNELVANALAHAFPGRAGTITVELAADAQRVHLVVADDGVGLPADLDPVRAKTLGLGLVMTFVEQLEARLEVRREQGTAFALVFPLPSVKGEQPLGAT